VKKIGKEKKREEEGGSGWKRVKAGGREWKCVKENVKERMRVEECGRVGMDGKRRNCEEKGGRMKKR
jgi:hypothetical protein